MARKLSEGEAFKLIKLYGENECLWDIKSQNYRNKEMRATALQSIAKEMQIEGLTPAEVKKKLKALRATYYLEVDKIQKSRSGVSGKVYVPKVKWFQELDSFIRNVTVKRRTIDISGTSNEDSDLSDDVTDGERAENVSTSTKETHNNRTTNNENNPPTPPAHTSAPRFVTETPNQSGIPRSKRTKLSHIAAVIKDLKSVSNDVNNILPTVEDSEFDIFGKHVAAQLRKLSEEQSVIAQEEIQKVLSKCRLTDIQKKANIYIYPSAHYSPNHSSP